MIGDKRSMKKVPSSRPTKRRRFQLFLIRPSHYDADGYVIQWLRSVVPANSLAALYGLALDCQARGVLGDDVELVVTAYNETNTRIRPERIARAIRKSGGLGMVGLVGVQSNQFPRAMDLARKLRAAGIQVCIGGFHVSGCLAMLPEMPADLKEALDARHLALRRRGGGAARRRAARRARRRMKPIYNFMDDLPALEDAVLPILPAVRVGRTVGRPRASMPGAAVPSSARSAPSSTCRAASRAIARPTTSRRSSAAISRRGSTTSSSPTTISRATSNWEAIFDRLDRDARKGGHLLRFIIQVDTLCHKLPQLHREGGPCRRHPRLHGAGEHQPESLLGAKKRQNHIAEYRTMLLEWKRVGCYTYAGYILGFPADTPESIVRDIKIIQRELPLDILEFFYLTPLPGSEDHKRLWLKGAPLDPDMNKYDLEHVCTAHPVMSKEEWERAYRLAWETYYTPEHMETVMRRAVAKDMSPGKILFLLMWFSCCLEIEGVHPLEGGLVRIKVRKDRRPGFPVESVLAFYPKYWAGLVAKYVKIARRVWRLARVRCGHQARPQGARIHGHRLAPRERGRARRPGALQGHRRRPGRDRESQARGRGAGGHGDGNGPRAGLGPALCRPFG